MIIVIIISVAINDVIMQRYLWYISELTSVYLI